MITFKQFLQSFKQKYVCLEFTEETNKALSNYALRNGFNLSLNYDGDEQLPNDFKFHTTIFYTSSSHIFPNNQVEIPDIHLVPMKLALLGKDKNIPVISLRLSSNLNKLRELFKNQGFKDVWPNYKPHISLSYDKKEYNLNDIPLPNFSIVANKVKIRDKQ